MNSACTKPENTKEQTIIEGSTKIKTTGKVFYNPVQEFNRDLRLNCTALFKHVFLILIIFPA